MRFLHMHVHKPRESQKHGKYWVANGPFQFFPTKFCEPEDMTDTAEMHKKYIFPVAMLISKSLPPCHSAHPHVIFPPLSSQVVQWDIFQWQHWLKVQHLYHLQLFIPNLVFSWHEGLCGKCLFCTGWPWAGLANQREVETKGAEWQNSNKI